MSDAPGSRRQGRHLSVIAHQDLEFRPLRARGPGGQNVNKVASAVQLRFDLAGSGALAPEEKARLRRLAGHRLTAEGTVLITADTHRTQAANRREALARLMALIEQARIAPKARIATAPTAASERRRLEHKRSQQRTKALRRAPRFEE